MTVSSDIASITTSTSSSPSADFGREGTFGVAAPNPICVCDINVRETGPVYTGTNGIVNSLQQLVFFR